MNAGSFRIVVAGFLVAALSLLPAGAGTNYVSLTGSNIFPYTSWANAATSIQSAVNAAANFDTVLVADGTYESGGMAIHGDMTNRVAITKAITVRSQNGPDFTFIKGYQVPGTTNGAGAVRCGYITNGAWLVGFTLTNGATLDTFGLGESQGGGIYCDGGGIISNCHIIGNSAYSSGGGAYSDISEGTFRVCRFESNAAAGGNGGGAYFCILEGCELTGNTAMNNGGGVGFCTVRNSVVSGNRAGWGGGGVSQGTIENSTISGNSSVNGGGFEWVTANNCLVTANTAQDRCGGSSGGTLRNCTIVDNEAGLEYGGAGWGAQAYNSILYFNTAPANPNFDPFMMITNCCTTPSPPPGNFTNAPMVVSMNNPHIRPGSPCIEAGNNGDAMGLFDIDGDLRINGTVDVGCDEYYSGAFTGSLSVAIIAEYTNSVVAGYPIEFRAEIDGMALGFVWSFGDGMGSTNEAALDHAFSTGGVYNVILTATNETLSCAATATVTVAAGFTNYVSMAGAHINPFTNWANASTTLQAAVDVAFAGGTVMAGDGVYQTGGSAVFGTMTNRVVLNRPVILRSLNGPATTTLMGSQVAGSFNGTGAVRCAYVGNGAILAGFTLSGGATLDTGDWFKELSGGGVWCESVNAIVSNCVISGNYAYANAGGAYQGTLVGCVISNNNVVSWGGGAVDAALYSCFVAGNISSNSAGGCGGGTLHDCHVSANWAGSSGGGVSMSVLYNSTVSGNSAASTAGGAANSVFHNSIVYYNTAPSDANYDPLGSSFTNSCTIPLPSIGAANFTNAPGLAGGKNPHIVFASVCRDTGSNAFVNSQNDIDGEGRLNGQVDVGCDEFWPAGITGGLAVTMWAQTNTTMMGAPLEFRVEIAGKPLGYRWSFGDGEYAWDVSVVEHVYTATGIFDTVLLASNYSGNVAATVTVTVVDGITNYVSLAGSHTFPFTNWLTAATTLQAAVDAAYQGGTIVVTNGMYEFGGTAVAGNMTNRVALNKAVTLRSVGGPAVTFIRGYQVPGTRYGNGAVRCVYMTNNAWLIGFTLTNGASLSSGDWQKEQSCGGVWCESTSAYISNCLIAGNAAYYYGGGAYKGSFYDCTFYSNYADYGGAAYEARLYDSTVVSNICKSQGGGLYSGWATNCALTFNIASNNSGGGSCQADLFYCRVNTNRAQNGGGAAQGMLYNCDVSSNRSIQYGGGVYYGVVSNSAIFRNYSVNGGGAYYGSMYASTIFSNAVSQRGGGAYGTFLDGCVIYTNIATLYGGGSAYATLTNCLVRNNIGFLSGGGSYGGTAYECVFSNNVSTNQGGGAALITCYNCLFVSNYAAWAGGIMTGSLFNCTVTRNSALNSGGGTYAGTLVNSIIYGNTAAVDANVSTPDSVTNSCTIPDPGGTGIITNDPQFLDAVSADFHLASNSPCINAGTNMAWTSSAGDLDGNPRIIYRTVDIGAYEYFRTPAGLPAAWQATYGFPTNGALDYDDPDGDGFENWREYYAGTIPDDILSFLGITSCTNAVTGFVLKWQSVAGKRYKVLSASNLTDASPFTFLTTNVIGQPVSTSYTDTTAVTKSPNFYRIDVNTNF